MEVHTLDILTSYMSEADVSKVYMESSRWATRPSDGLIKCVYSTLTQLGVHLESTYFAQRREYTKIE